MTELPSTAEAYILQQLFDAEAKVEKLEEVVRDLEIDNRELEQRAADYKRLLDEEPQTAEMKD